MPGESWAYRNALGQLLRLHMPESPPGIEVLGLDSSGMPVPDVYRRHSARQRGHTFLGARMQKRQMGLRMGLQCDSLAELETWQHTLNAVLNPELGMGRLEIIQADGAHRWLDCYVVSGLEWGGDGINMFARRFVPIFEAPEPAFYDPAPVVVSFTGIGGGLVWSASGPPTFPMTFTDLTPSVGVPTQVRYGGSVPTEPIFTVYGPMINPILMHVQAQKYIKFRLTLGAADVLTVDMRFGKKLAQLAAHGTIYNALPYIASGSQFWDLQPGNQIVFLSCDGPHPGGHIDMQWTTRYVTLGGSDWLNL